MKVAVFGHIEWGRFAKVERVPAPGEIIHAKQSWQEVAGGGSVAAMQLAKLADECLFFTAVGDDDMGRQAINQLETAGVRVHATTYDNRATSEAWVYIDEQNDRTITVLGDSKPTRFDASLPWGELASSDAVFFVSGSLEAILQARQAGVLVSTARILPLIKQANIELDALVCSAKDDGELYRPGDLVSKPRYVITTKGHDGGEVDDGTTYSAVSLSNDQVVDTYGCGDSFAAGLTYALGSGMELVEALKLAAESGAEAAQRRGAFGNG